MKAQKGRRLRKGNAALLAGGLILLTAGLCFGMSALSPVRLYDSAPEVEIDGIFNPRDNIYSVFMGSKDDVSIKGKVDTATPGSYEIEYIYKDRSWPITVTVADFTPPVLQLKNLTVAVLDEVDAESFVETIEDASKVSLKVDNPGSLKAAAGTRNVTITAMDEYGNKTTRNTTLTRIVDTETPSVQNTEDERTLLINTMFEPVELIIEDNSDSECQVDINLNDINMEKTGSYTVTYTVSDTSGNRTSWSETIHVTDDPYDSRLAENQEAQSDGTENPNDPASLSDEQSISEQDPSESDSADGSEAAPAAVSASEAADNAQSTGQDSDAADNGEDSSEEGADEQPEEDSQNQEETD